MFKTIFDKYHDWKRTQEEAKKIVQKKKKEESIKAKYYAVALAFNSLHCHTGDDQWMCPNCNKIHDYDREKTKEWGWLTGRQYPACCRFDNSHRLFFDLYATTGETTKG